MSEIPAEPALSAETASRPVLRRNRGSAAVIHAAPPTLDPVVGSDAALRQIGLVCLVHLSRNEAAALAGAPGGIHQMRVAVRRLRAILSGFGDRLPEHQRHWAFEELRWFAGALGPVRNLDVFEAVLLRPAQRAASDRSALEPLRHAVERQRRAAHRDAVAAIRSDRYANLITHLFRWCETCGWRYDRTEPSEPPVGETAACMLQRRWRVAKKRGEDFAAQSPSERHRLRIALKKLRYTAEALSSFYPSEQVASFAARLKRLQDDLGHANDVRVGHEILGALASDTDSGSGLAEAGRQMLAWHEQRLLKTEPKMRKHLRELFETEPFWRS